MATDRVRNFCLSNKFLSHIRLTRFAGHVRQAREMTVNLVRWEYRACGVVARSAGMEMHQVRYFLAVAQELNFSRAAEKCNVSQPSLSRAIQQLEGEFGGPLFHRERHLTHLTDLGEMVRPHLET